MHRLVVKNISKKIKKTEIIKDISLEVKSGEIVGLLGPNGAGKTTTFYIICGLIQSSSGAIYFDDIDISQFAFHKRALKGIGYLPQESSIFKDLSVEENLYLASEVVRDESGIRAKRVEELLNLFNIEPIRARLGISLSGGERRRVEIARALVSNPKFLLLDEPFAGVDPLAINDIQAVIRQLASINIGILITDHNVRETLSICDRSYVIKSGSLLTSGSSDEIYKDELVKKHYLGENFNT